MRILAIETATEACSVALFEDGALLDARHEVLGRGHAERLVPMIAELPDKGRADEIRVSLGPGSFTGVRIGLATARALAIVWGATVRGYPTLALVAAMARQDHPGPIGVCMNGGHGEWFVQPFDAAGLPIDTFTSQPPEAAMALIDCAVVAGNRAVHFGEAANCGTTALELLPNARHALSLPGELLVRSLAPLYGRAPDAKLPGQ